MENSFKYLNFLFFITIALCKTITKENKTATAICTLWNETINMVQSTENIQNNAHLMHRITVELRKRHSLQRVKSVDILYDGDLVARKVGVYNVTSNITFMVENDTREECIIFRIAVDDINECDLGIHKCLDKNMLCVNTVGSYQCECRKGFVVDHECKDDYLDNDNCKSAQKCLDVDECIGENICPANSKCINTYGNFTCQCLPGFNDTDSAHPGMKCVDIDECKTPELNKCSKYAACNNTQGSYNCTCTPGYEGDGHTCVPRQSCDFTDHDCVETAKCVPCVAGNTDCIKINNRPAYYQCHCPIGFIGDGRKTGTKCTDIDECKDANKTKICGEHAKCLNQPGKYECQCEPGYQMTTSFGREVCRNVNECSLRKGIDKGAHDCNDNAVCHDTDGSFECICNYGFKTNEILKGHSDNGCIDQRPPTVKPKGEQNMILHQYDSYAELGIVILHARLDSSQHKYRVEWHEALQYEYLLDIGSYPKAVNYSVSVPDNHEAPFQSTYRNIEILDLNECVVPTSDYPTVFHPICHPLADCVNTKGSYSCACRSGYTCPTCDGFQNIKRNWNDEPWFGHVPVGYLNGTGCVDTRPPVITLLGNLVEEIELCKCGSLMEEPRHPADSEFCVNSNGKCFTAFDENDGDLTSKVTVTQETLGNRTWRYIYTVSDAHNNTANATRTAKVVDLDLINKMKDMDLMEDKLESRIKRLSRRITAHSKSTIIMLVIFLLAFLASFLLLGYATTTWYLLLYIINPILLIENRHGYEIAADTYLRIRSLGAMNDIERRRRIIADWTLLFDEIHGCEDSEEEYEDSDKSISENDSDGDTHVTDDSSKNLDQSQDLSMDTTYSE